MKKLDRAKPSDARLRYTAPKLTVYGEVKTLTAAGTAGVSEAGSGAINKIFP